MICGATKTNRLKNTFLDFLTRLLSVILSIHALLAAKNKLAGAPSKICLAVLKSLHKREENEFLILYYMILNTASTTFCVLAAAYK